MLDAKRNFLYPKRKMGLLKVYFSVANVLSHFTTTATGSRLLNPPIFFPRKMTSTKRISAKEHIDLLNELEPDRCNLMG